MPVDRFEALIPISYCHADRERGIPVDVVKTCGLLVLHEMYSVKHLNADKVKPPFAFNFLPRNALQNQRFCLPHRASKLYDR